MPARLSCTSKPGDLEPIDNTIAFSDGTTIGLGVYSQSVREAQREMTFHLIGLGYESAGRRQHETGEV